MKHKKRKPAAIFRPFSPPLLFEKTLLRPLTITRRELTEAINQCFAKLPGRKVELFSHSFLIVARLLQKLRKIGHTHSSAQPEEKTIYGQNHTRPKTLRKMGLWVCFYSFWNGFGPVCILKAITSQTEILRDIYFLLFSSLFWETARIYFLFGWLGFPFTGRKTPRIKSRRQAAKKTFFIGTLVLSNFLDPKLFIYWSTRKRTRLELKPKASRQSKKCARGNWDCFHQNVKDWGLFCQFLLLSVPFHEELSSLSKAMNALLVAKAKPHYSMQQKQLLEEKTPNK